MKFAILLLGCCSLYGQISSSTARHIIWGTALPTTCTPSTGDIFFKTTATVGPYYCSATNTWTAMSGGGGASPGAPDGSLQYRANSTTLGGVSIAGVQSNTSRTVDSATFDVQSNSFLSSEPTLPAGIADYAFPANLRLIDTCVAGAGGTGTGTCAGDFHTAISAYSTDEATAMFLNQQKCASGTSSCGQVMELDAFADVTGNAHSYMKGLGVVHHPVGNGTASITGIKIYAPDTFYLTGGLADYTGITIQGPGVPVTSGGIGLNVEDMSNGNDYAIKTGTGAVDLGGVVNIQTTALTDAGAPTLATVGTAGSTTYGYQVAACNPVGCSVAANEATIATGNATLDGTNYVTVTTAAVIGASYCAVWRTTGATYGIIGRPACGAVLNDQGQTAEGAGDYNQAYPTTRNFSAGFYSGTNAQFGNYPIGSQSNSIYGGQPTLSNTNMITSGISGDFVAPTTFTTIIDPPADLAQFTDVFHYVALGGSHTTSNLIGENLDVEIGNSSNISDRASGLESSIFNDSSGTVNQLVGVRAHAIAGSGTTTEAIGVKGQARRSGGTLTTAIALQAESGDGTVTNNYGLKVEDQSNGTNNWAIKTGVGKVDFGDAVSAAGGSANKAVCWKSDGKTLGYCSSVVGADGSCTCN